MDVLFGAVTIENRRRDRLVIQSNLMGYTDPEATLRNEVTFKDQSGMSLQNMANTSQTSISMYLPPSATEESMDRYRVWTIPEETHNGKW